MGLLDDAIREHLELKRRHGASEEEISQEEAEALGPARREFPAAAADAQDADAQDADVQDADVQNAEVQGADEALPDEPAPMGAEPELVEEPPEPEQAAEPAPDPPTSDLGPPTSDLGPPTSDDDVLEETPEFLQDAPEHDRLWFEQKPPRDFDFE